MGDLLMELKDKHNNIIDNEKRLVQMVLTQGHIIEALIEILKITPEQIQAILDASNKD